MMRAILIVGMLCLAALLPPAQGQAADGLLSIVSMGVTAGPVVGVSVGSLVTVWNPSSSSQSATVAWSYNDNAPLNPQTPTMAYNEMTQVIDPMTNFTFTFPFTPDAGHKGNQTIVARLTGVSQTSSQPGPNATRSLSIFVAHPRLNLTLDTAPLPGVLDSGAGFFKFHVRNDGNVNETPNVSITTDPNFNLTILGNFSPIRPGGSATGEIIVRPLTSNESINLTANLSVASSINRLVNASLPAPPLHVNASLVLRNHSAALTPLPPSLQVRATGNRTVSATLTNTGEGSDVYNVTALVAPAGSGMNVSLALGASSANRTLPANGSYVVGLHPRESITFDLVLAYNATLGDGNASVRLNVTSANANLLAPRHPGQPTGASASSRLAPAGPQPALVRIEGRPDAYPTDAPSFRFEVANLGLDPSGPATLRALVQDNLQVAARQNITIPALAPGATHQAAWSVPLSEMRGQYVLAATLEPNANDTDMDPADNAQTFAFYVRSPALRLDVPKELSVTPGGTLSVVGGPKSLLLKNLGDKEESFHVTLASTAAWLAAAWDVSIPSGVTMTLPLDLAVPERVGTESLVATVRAEILGHASYQEERTIAVRVVPIDTPTIAFSPLPAGTVRRPYAIEATLGDSIGIRHAEARIARPDGVTHVLALFETRPGVWSADYVPAVRGSYAVEVFVEGAGDAERTSRATQTWTVGTAEYEGVVPLGFQEGGIVGNTTLRLDDADAGTTRLLVADVGKGPEPVPYPYEIHADFWKEGRHAIRLAATSIDGVVWERTINVTLDRTPPPLSDASVQPQPGGKLLLSVRSTGAARVVASISTPSGPITVPMTRSAGGAYVASALAPEKWSSVTFVSTGENGVEATVAVASVEGKAVPGAGWAALAGLAVAAIFARKKR